MPDNFDDVRAALAKATPGQWGWYWMSDGEEADCAVSTHSGVCVFRAPRYVRREQWAADGELVCLTHNRLPAILAALDAANARLAEAEGLLIGCLAAHHGDNAMSPEDWRNLARFLKESPDAQ